MVDFENSTAIMMESAAPVEETTECSAPSELPPKKKRNLPGMPDPDAEVLALSPKTLMATNRFVCEICSKGFQRDQNLQLHRRGHNLPWKLKQRSGKEIRKRVYVCPEQTCVHHDPSRALGDLTGIKKHFCRKHGEKKWKCERCSKKYAVQSDWKAHMKTCGTREYRCDCGTLFSRRDSFITHRAFCDALAQESVRSQNLAIHTTEGSQKVEAVAPPSTSSPPPPPLTPTTVVLSPVLSIQSSDVPESAPGMLPHPQMATTYSAATTNSGGGSGSTSTGNVSNTSGVFASIFASSTVSQQSSQSSPSSYSDMLCAAVASGTERSTVEPMALSLSSSLYLTGNSSNSLFPTSDHDHHRHYTPPTQPALSATALLQKAAQMGATASNSSFLRGLGLAMPGSSDRCDHNNTSRWNSQAKQDGSNLVVSAGLGLRTDLMMDQPATLDFLGLGMGVGGAGGGSSSAYPAFFTSIGGGLDVSAPSFQTVEDPWDDSADRKPTLL